MTENTNEVYSDSNAHAETWHDTTLSNKERIEAWYSAHPDGTQSQCVQGTGIGKSTVSTYWPGKRRAKPTKEAPQPERTTLDERMTIVMTDKHKRRLKAMAALDGITAAEWIAQRIDRDYPDYSL